MSVRGDRFDVVRAVRGMFEVPRCVKSNCRFNCPKAVFQYANNSRRLATNPLLVLRSRIVGVVDFSLPNVTSTSILALVVTSLSEDEVL